MEIHLLSSRGFFLQDGANFLSNPVTKLVVTQGTTSLVVPLLDRHHSHTPLIFCGLSGLVNTASPSQAFLKQNKNWMENLVWLQSYVELFYAKLHWLKK